MRYVVSCITVVIPCYRPVLIWQEALSFYQTITRLSKYPILLIGPRSNASVLRALSSLSSNIGFRLYPDACFSSQTAYGNLMLAPSFYDTIDTEYILIAQLDCWVLSDRLDSFVGYSYIGPPIHLWPPYPRLADSTYYGAGIGGFSLRRCSAMRKVLISKRRERQFVHIQEAFHQFNLRGRMQFLINISKEMYQQWRVLSSFPSAYPFLGFIGIHEDWIFGVIAPRLGFYPLVSEQESMSFGLDYYAEEYLSLMAPAVPFGLHAWYKCLKRQAALRSLIQSSVADGWQLVLQALLCPTQYRQAEAYLSSRS